MIFLANENFPFPSIHVLRNASFDIESIKEKNPGISDQSVIEYAHRTGRIILTFDKDYGELIFRYNMINPPDVVFFRYKGASPVQAGLALIALLQQKKIDLCGFFTVIEKSSVRQRKY